jgi:hypothetical protein
MILIIAGLPLVALLRNGGHPFETPQGADLAHQLYTGTVTLFLPLGAFLAATNIMSTDRHQGFFRFYFSKPVSVLAFYVQAYVLHGLAFVALFGAITWGFGALTVHQSVPGAMAAAAMTFVLVGGVGFLLGTLTRFDGAALALVYVLSMLLQQLSAQRTRLPNGGLPEWVAQLARVLPPVHTLDELRSQLYASAGIEPAQLWHVAGYGAGAFIVGALVLRRAPLAR